MIDTKAPNPNYRLLLHNDIKEINRLTGFIEAIGEEIGLTTSVTMSINLAIEEAVTNVILYAYPFGTDGLVYIDAFRHPSSIDFVVSDSGMPFDPTAAPEAKIDVPLEDRSIGGLGIHLVRRIMDSVTYRRSEGKNYFTMTKNI